MSTSNDQRPAPSRPAGINWREAARRTCLDVDWGKVAHSALGPAFLAGLVGGALHVIGKAIEAEMHADAEAARIAAETPPAATCEDCPDADTAAGADAHRADEGVSASDAEHTADGPPMAVDEKAAEAAALLGVDANASADEIRAALRSHLASSRLHPDQGGDGEAATRFISAKNLLIERARAVKS
jgi:hypothetical protein